MVLAYLYLQNWVIFGVNVGKYSSTMEHLGCELLIESYRIINFIFIMNFMTDHELFQKNIRGTMLEMFWGFFWSQTL